MTKLTGYIEKKIKGFGLVGFKFGMNAFAKLCEMQNIALSEMASVLHQDSPQFLGAMRDLIYSAAYAATKEAGKDVVFTPETVGTWIDNMPQKDFTEIMEAMNTAKFMGESLAQVIEKKTKATPKKN